MKRLKRYLSPERRPTRPLHIDVKLHNGVIIIYPKDDLDDPDQPPDYQTGAIDGCVVSGQVSISHEPLLQVNNVRIGVVVIGNYDLPESLPAAQSRHQEGVIFEKYQTFLESDMKVGLSANARHIKSTIDFDIVLPSSVPTWESLPGTEILAQIRVLAEYGYNTLSLTPITSIDRGNRAEQPSQPASNVPDMIMKKWSGVGNVEHPSYHDTRVKDHDDIEDDGSDRQPASPFHREHQSHVINFPINASPPGMTGTPSLAEQRTGQGQGLGRWSLGYRSEMFLVAGYVRSTLHLEGLSSRCAVFAIRTVLVQNCSVMPLDEFHQVGIYGTWHALTTAKHVIASVGTLPRDKRPSRQVPRIWPPSEHSIDKPSTAYRWESGPQRLPDDSIARPTTSAGTSTPIRFKHELVTQVYFSIEGENIDGTKITGSDQTGELRMLVIPVSVVLPSCICVSDRMDLPGYMAEQSGTAPSSSSGICACCYALADLKGSGDEEPATATSAPVAKAL